MCLIINEYYTQGIMGNFRKQKTGLLNQPIYLNAIKRNIFKKVRTETILKIYNTLVLPTFLYGLDN